MGRFQAGSSWRASPRRSPCLPRLPLIRCSGRRRGLCPATWATRCSNTFTLGWDASRIPHGFSGVWSAPFFFPLEDTLAWSEHLLGIAVFTSPVIWVTGNPVLAYNLAFLGSYVLAGVGMYLLARALWGRRDAALLAALAFAFAPYRVMYVAHLQVLMSGWLPLSLWGLHRYFDTGSRRALAVFAGTFALAGLSNGYFLYFFAVPVAAVAACHLGRSWLTGSGSLPGMARWREPIDLGWAALAILTAMMPAALAYLRVRRAFGSHRAADEIAAFSARWADYLRIPDGLWLWSGALRVGEAERMLSPGMAIVALAAAAGLSLARSWWSSAIPQPVRWAWHVGVYAVILGLAVWLAAGPAVPGPYGPLLRVVPGLDGLRVPARLVVVVSLALSVLGSAGAAWVLSRLRPRAATIATLAVGSVIGPGGLRRTDAHGAVQPCSTASSAVERVASERPARRRARAATRRPGSRAVHAGLPVQHALSPPPGRQRVQRVRVCPAGLSRGPGLTPS